MSSHKNDFWGNVYHMCSSELNDGKFCAFACKRTLKSPFVRDRERHKCSLQEESMDSEVHITGQQGSLGTFFAVQLFCFSIVSQHQSEEKHQGIRGEHEPSSYGTKRLYCHAQTQRSGRFRGFPTVLLHRKQRESKNLEPSLPTSIVQALTHSNIHRYVFMCELLSLKCMLHIPKYPTYDSMRAHLNISCSFKTKSNSHQPAITESFVFLP